MRDQITGYDQADYYNIDDDPVVELRKCIDQINEYIEVHAEISDLTTNERLLLTRCKRVMEETSEYIEESGI